MILSTDLDPRPDASGCASSIAARLAVQHRSGSVHVDLSAGVDVAVYPDDGRELEALVRHADAAMDRTRATDRGSRRGTGAPCA